MSNLTNFVGEDWNSLPNKPAVIAAGATAADARTAIGAGTSDLTLGVTGATALAGDTAFQTPLVSGTSIKTVNSTSLLGSGDVAVQPTLVSGTNIKTVNSTSLLGSGNLAVGDVTLTGTQTLTNKTISGTSNTITVDGTNPIGFLAVPQNDQATTYTLVLSDSGKHIHKSGTSAYTVTIPANASVAFPIGTAVTFVNSGSSGAMTIAITSDTLRIVGAGTTGSKTLAAYGVATAIKVTSTLWMISGSGLT